MVDAPDASGGPPALLSLPCPRCHEPAELLEPEGKVLVFDRSGERATLHRDYRDRSACHRCRIAAADPPHAAELRAHYGRLLAIRDRLGIPPAATFHVLFAEAQEAVPHLRDFRVTLFGLRAQNWMPTSPVPSVMGTPDDGRPSFGFVFPLIVIALPGVPAVLEFRWSMADPTSPETTMEVVGWQQVSRVGDLKRLLDGVEWLRRFEGGRRPRGLTSVPSDEFAARLPAVYAALRHRLGRRPSNQELADAFSVGKKTFERYRRDYRRGGGAWPPSREK